MVPSAQSLAAPASSAPADAVLEALHTPVALLRGGVVEAANEALCRLCGRPRAELLGRPVGDLLGVQPTPDAPGAPSTPGTLRLPDGTAVPVEVRCARAPGDAPGLAVLSLEPRRTEPDTPFATLLGLGRIIATLDEERIREEALAAFVRAGMADAAALLARRAGRLVLDRARGVDPAVARLFADDETVAQAARGADAQFFVAAAAPPALAALLAEAGCASAALLPLRTREGGETVVLLRRGAAAPGPAERALAAGLARALALGLENARLHAETTRQVREITRLFELGQAVAGEMDLPRVFGLACSTARALVEADEVVLLVPAPEAGGRPHLQARSCVHGPGSPEAGCLLGGGAREAVELAAALGLDALRQRASLASGAAGPRPRMAAAPLLVGDRPAGSLVAVRGAAPEAGAGRRPGDGDVAPFTGADLQRLGAVADYVALAMHSARLFAEQQHRVRELMLLNDVAAACAEMGLDRLAPAVLERICRALGAGLAGLVLTDPDRQDMFLGAVSTQDGPFPNPRTRFPLDRGPLARVIASRQPRRGQAEELLSEEIRAEAQRRGLLHWTAVPLVIADRLIGMVTLLSARATSDDELRLLGAMCAQISVAIDNARLFGETQRRAADLALVRAVGDAVARSLDPGTMLREAATRLAEALEADSAGVWVRDGRSFRNACSLGMAPRLAVETEQLPLNDPVVELALSSSAPLGHEGALLPQPTRGFLAGLGIEQIAVAPLVTGSPGGGAANCAGMLVLGRRAPRRFGPDELRVLGAVASQLAVALQNAQLYEEMRHRVEDLAVVLEASRALIGAAPLDEALDVVADRLARLVGVSCAEILLLDPQTQVLRGAGSSLAVRDRKASLVIGPDEPSLARQALKERRPLWSGDPDRDPRVNPAAQRARRARYYAALPLLTADKVVGVAMLFDTDRVRRLSEADLDRAMAIGNQVAIAIERARLNSDLERSYQELARTQAQLVKRERLAALGELAALVAHEVRNPLGVIFNALGSLGKLVEFEGDARTLYRIIREEATRLDRIVGDLLDFARPTEPALEPGALDRVVGTAVSGAQAFERTRGTPPDRLHTVVRVDPALPPVPMDERQLRQALMNLLANAFQAVGRGGGHVEVDAGLVVKAGRRWARVSVRDDGPGIPPEMRARLFEPFVTTKATGSGLGLAVVKRIVEGHRGEVAFESEPGRGTVFFLDLPLAEPGGAAPARRDDSAAGGGPPR